MAAYTLAGSVTSALTGAVLSWLGELFLPGQVSRLGILIAMAVAVVAIARELGWISFPLPQLRRQTRGIWARVFPSTLAATFWGLDLGLIFTTWLTFSGVWLLVVVAFLTRVPTFGAALFTTYWLGRALSVWIAPLLMSNASATPRFLDRIFAQYRLFQRIHALGLIWSVAVFILWFNAL